MKDNSNPILEAIAGLNAHPPVVIPYLDYYYPLVVDRLTPYSETDLQHGDLDTKIDAFTRMHEYVGCDWVRVTTDPPFAGSMSNGRDEFRSVDQLLDSGRFDLARELTRRLGASRFVYGRVGIPYCHLFRDFTNMAEPFVALKLEPERCIDTIESSIPQILEEIKAWAETGVHGLWLGEWLSAADTISEADYLRFALPYDRIVVEAVRSAGLIPIFHSTGNVIPRLPHIKEINPPVFGAEESKKGFDVDVARIRAGLGSEICLLGNIDVYDVVELGMPETWAAEVERQVRAAGPGRFIVSCGSPITPDTPPERLRAFVQTARQVCAGA